jgi:hypothetical protein
MGNGFGHDDRGDPFYENTADHEALTHWQFTNFRRDVLPPQNAVAGISDY